MHRPPRIRVSGLVWTSDDRLVLIRQGRPTDPRWMLPGGGVEGGETLVGALERELREEIGLHSCTVGDPVAMVESIAPEDSGSGRHVVHMIFQVTCHPDDLDGLGCHDPDIHEVRLVPRAELATWERLHPPIADFLATWTHGDGEFSYFGPLWAP